MLFRSQVFVANRVGTIQSLTSVSQWSHVSGKENPYDIASRGCPPEELSKSIWFTSPEFLHKPGSFDHTPLYYPISDKDENVSKIAVCRAVNIDQDFYSKHLSHVPTYTRLFRVVARILKWAKCFKSKTRIGRDVMSVSDRKKQKFVLYAWFNPLFIHY